MLDRTRFKVKLLYFKRNGKLSNQFHYHRSELWLYIFGMNAGNFRMIAPKETHTFYSMRPTLVLEIQYGSKCDEKDIVRL